MSDIIAGIVLLIMFTLFFYGMSVGISDNAFTLSFCQENGFEEFVGKPTPSCVKDKGSILIYQKIDCVAYGFFPEERIRTCELKEAEKK